MDKKTEAAIEDSLDEIDVETGVEEESTEKPEEPKLEEKTKKKFRPSKKMIIWLVILAIVFGAICAVPFLRYGFFGMFVRKNVELIIVDSSNQRPVVDARIEFGRFDAVSDTNGKVVIKDMPVGEYNFKIEKQNYETLEGVHTVAIFNTNHDATKAIKATGRSLNVRVINQISGQPISGASVNFSGATDTSDSEGIASVVLPANDETQTGEISAEGYLNKSVEFKIAENGDQKLEVKLTPSGKIYFLSKRTGVIDVMSSNLDGSSQETVVKGTGHESNDGTSLFAAPDWKNFALVSRRDGDRPKLYIYDGTLKLIDSDDVTFDPIGWVSGKLFYVSYSNKANPWDNGRQQIIRYDVASGARTVVDRSVSSGSGNSGYAAQSISRAYIQGESVVYSKCWSYSGYYQDTNKPVSINAIDVSNSNRRTLKEIASSKTTYCDAKQYRASSVAFRLQDVTGKLSFYEYNGGNIRDLNLNDAEYIDNQISYIKSPDGKKVFWSEVRDGKLVSFVANADLSDSKQVSSSDYSAYGWFGNGYVLYSRGGNQLFVAQAGVKLDGAIKITDYHKPYLYENFGGGYGASA